MARPWAGEGADRADKRGALDMGEAWHWGSVRASQQRDGHSCASVVCMAAWTEGQGWATRQRLQWPSLSLLTSSRENWFRRGWASQLLAGLPGGSSRSGPRLGW